MQISTRNAMLKAEQSVPRKRLHIRWTGASSATGNSPSEQHFLSNGYKWWCETDRYSF